ncbi:MAG: response regulator [Prosthecobacter sp.]|uniref:response regulator transcription factor n=1 Tax=Prosthecobacter sp. TaxID=1965333 RepID=UPI0019EF8EBC|nr:response regulator [Prosthecobacter sp.]MBE2285127.1 response regulator [Prosthecobacter sp.]
MPTKRPTIFLIDDDASVRRALGRVMTSAGLDYLAFESADEFLACKTVVKSGCIVADMTLPGLSGLDLKHALNARHSKLPLIFLTAHDTTESRSAAHEAGAEAYFRKPVDTQALLDAIHWALNEPQDSSPLSSIKPQTQIADIPIP